MSIRFWHDKYASRYHWAFQEYDRFIHSLEPSIAGEFGRKDQITVVLYGHTQAGKTTVLLTLLGIEDRFFNQVSTILRGGRPEGNSATATATFYAKSFSEKWSMNDLHDLSDNEMLEQLTAIRQKVNQGAYQSTDPIRIEIPSCYFHPTRFDNVGFQIIDLPGTCCENDNERELVSKIAATYVPYADMVLIVNDASKLTYLQSENMVLDQLKTWYVLPEKFHLILTRSFFADSNRREFSKMEKLSATTVRNLMLKELQNTLGEKECPVNSGNFHNFFYPLDCGHSWQQLREQDPKYFHSVEPIMADFFKNLTDDIIRSATPLGRVRMAGRIKPVAEHHKEKRIKEYNSEKDAILHEREQIQQKYDEIKNKKEELNTKKEALLEKQQTYRLNMRKLFPTGIRISPFPAPYKLEERRTNVIQYLDSEIKRLTVIWSVFHKYTSEAEMPLEEMTLFSVLAPLNNINRSKLGGWGGGHETYLLSGYAKDCKKVEDESNNSCKALTNLIVSKNNEFEKALDKSLKSLEDKLAPFPDFLKKYETSLAEKDESLKILEDKHEIFIKAIDQTIAQASSFHKRLCDAFENNALEEISILRKMRDPIEKFWQLCYLKLLKDTKKEILSNE